MSKFRIKTCTVGQMGTNCYIVYQEDLKRGVIVDPGENGPYILNTCRELGVTPEAVALTHGHFDHIMAVEEVKEAFPGILVYAAEKEAGLLADPGLNLSQVFGKGFSVKADRLMREGDIMNLAGMKWTVMETPGHTAGSVCFLPEGEGVVISGDTLFAESLGRTDFPTGSAAEIIKSITGKLFVLPEDTMVYPGHGDPTTIGHEKKYNPVAFYKGQV